MLEDVQGRPDDRQLPIGEVGISGIRYPVAVWDRENGSQDTVAEVSMSVDLRADVKGAHLSRFVEVLDDCAGVTLSPQTMPVILGNLRQRLAARRAEFSADFPYFMRRSAPVTGAAALMDYQCRLSAPQRWQHDGHYRRRCGCPSPASARAARRSATTEPITSAGTSPCGCGLATRAADRPRCGSRNSIEVAEASASSPVFPLLKRPDERYVTMQAHDHPVFVEDMARAAAAR